MKKFTLIRFTAFILFLFSGFCVQSQTVMYPDAWNQAGFSLLSSNDNSVEVNFSIPEFTLEDAMINSEIMKTIQLPGNFLFNDEGAPNLPGNGKIIAMPQGATPELEITASRTEVFKNVNIAPAPRIPKDNEKGPLNYRKDAKIYSVDAYYPAKIVAISGTMKIRGVDAVMLGITPFQYNPVTKELIVYRDLKVTLHFNGGNGHIGDDRLRSRWWDPILEDALFNSTSLPKINYDSRYSSKGSADATGAEYLIITPNGAAFLQYADSIKKFRTEQGISTIIKTLTEVGGNTITAIESYINNAYNTWTTPPAAILLLGDYGTDASSTVISPIYNSYCASDNIYGDVDGDHLPDIVMARITANNTSQLSVMVSKFLNYERNPPTSASFYAHPITALGWQTERWFQICSETIGGFWKNVQGKTPVRINEVYDGNPSADPWSSATNTASVISYFGPAGLGYIPATPQSLGGWTGGNATAINNAINNGSFMLQHRDHGMETGWGEPSYVSSNIDGLVNTDLTYIMSINCLTGKYDYSSECFAEKFHRYTHSGANSGALGIMAATEVSYSFVNDAYVWGMYDNLWPNFMPAYGTTPASRGVLPAFGNAAGKIFLAQSSWPYNTEDKEVTYNLFHHHGDAFLTVYSEVPQNLTVTHSPVLYAGVTTFAVAADVNALIALSVNGQIIGTATGTGSFVNITIPGQIPPDQMIVTVTKQNFFRYKSVVSIVPASGPYVVYTAHALSDPAPGGNNNGLMDFGETNQFSVSVKNVGIQAATNVISTLSSSDSYVTITESSENYGDISPDQTVIHTNAFSCSIANNIPDQHIVSFNLSSTNGADTWISHFNSKANAPFLAIGAITVQDNGPGCNNDGILDPGETANLLISNSNSGHAEITNVSGNLTIMGGTSPYLVINSGISNLGNLAIGGSGNTVFNVTASLSTPIGTPVGLACVLTGGVTGQYSATETKQIVIGLIPTYIMNNGTITTCPGNFFDSGGESGAYQSSENYTETFLPSTPGNMIRFVFSSFATESGYDYLKIYNGTTTAAPLLGTYHGSTGPGTVTASNASGALTFNFTSDGSVTGAGWTAGISCYNSSVPPVAAFSASSTTPAINSTVTFTDQSINIPTSWAWSFSPNTVVYTGGTSAASQNPQVQFTAIGQYTVTLTATNSYGSDAEIKTNYINVILYTYCTPAYTTGTGSGDYITLVQLGTINNATGASASPYYTYYSSLSTNLTPGNDYTITLSPGTYTSGNNISVWIDYNQNGVFETTEKLGNVVAPATPATSVINFTVPAGATMGLTRMRVREVYNNSSFDACTSYTYGETEDYNINILSLNKSLNLTVFLEGLFNGTTMRKAQNSTGDQYPGTVADQVTVELHNSASPYAIAGGPYTVNVNTDGTASATVPASLGSSYYIVVKHRNSLTTWNGSPLSFSGAIISYDFSTSANQAFGSNLKLISGKYVIFGGDVNQDGFIDSADMTPADNDAFNYITGYYATDINGDGTIDTADMTTMDNNGSIYVGVITP